MVTARHIARRSWIVTGMLCCCFLTACASSVHQLYYHFMPDVRSASFSPANDTIAVVLLWRDINGIILFTNEGTALKWLCKTTNRHYYLDPSFSPDGKLLAYVSNIDEENGNIYIMNTDGSNVRRLTNTTDYDRRPIFSPDGNTVFFLRFPRNSGYPNFTGSAGSHRGDVWCVDTNSLAEKRITNYSFSRIYNLATLPDGEHILISVSNPPEVLYGLWKLNINQPANISTLAPDLTPYAVNPTTRHSPKTEPYIEMIFRDVSRDGRYLIFGWSNHEAKGADRISQIYLTNLADMKTAKITNFTRRTTKPLAISADGQLILLKNYPSPNDTFQPVMPLSPLFIVNRDGSGLRNLTLDFTAIWPEVLQARKERERGW